MRWGIIEIYGFEYCLSLQDPLLSVDGIMVDYSYLLLQNLLVILEFWFKLLQLSRWISLMMLVGLVICYNLIFNFGVDSPSPLIWIFAGFLGEYVRKLWLSLSKQKREISDMWYYGGLSVGILSQWMKLRC